MPAALSSVENRPAGKLLAIAPSAAAPVRLWLGSRTHPDEAVLTLHAAFPRNATGKPWKWTAICNRGPLRRPHSRRSRHWHRSYPDLHHLTAKAILCACKPPLRIRGSGELLGVFLGLESLSLNAEASRERLVTGGVSSAPIMDPRHAIPAGSAYVKYPAGAGHLACHLRFRPASC